MFNEKEVRSLIEAFVENTDEYYSSSESVYRELKYLSRGSVLEVPELGLLEAVEDYGGEGQGEEFWVVFRVVSTGQLFRVDGYYSSYDGGSLDGSPYEVVPVEKTITVYERKA